MKKKVEHHKVQKTYMSNINININININRNINRNINININASIVNLKMS